MIDPWEQEAEAVIDEEELNPLIRGLAYGVALSVPVYVLVVWWVWWY